MCTRRACFLLLCVGTEGAAKREGRPTLDGDGHADAASGAPEADGIASGWKQPPAESTAVGRGNAAGSALTPVCLPRAVAPEIVPVILAFLYTDRLDPDPKNRPDGFAETYADPGMDSSACAEARRQVTESGVGVEEGKSCYGGGGGWGSGRWSGAGWPNGMSDKVSLGTASTEESVLGYGTVYSRGRLPLRAAPFIFVPVIAFLRCANRGPGFEM